MEPIQAEQAVRALKRYAGRRIYLHFEFTRGGFVRNVAADVTEVHVRGEGPYRVALRCEGEGWVVMEGLTHMAERAGEPLFFGALDSDADQRLAHALQLSLEPFTP
jgi:hypothetical protein